MDTAIAKWTASAGHALREFFLLPTALATVRARSPRLQEEIGALLAAANRRRRAARAQTRPSEAPAALTLLGEAAVLMVRASDLQRRGSISAEHELSTFASSLEPTDGAPASLQRVLAALADPRPLAQDELPSNAARALQTDADDVLEWIGRSIEARTPRAIQASRFVRVAVAAASVAVLGVALGAGGRGHEREPRNVALNRPVRASSRRANTPPEAGPAGLDPSGLVDGQKRGAYDVCTNNEVNAWVMVDLERVEPVTKVQVHNRGDCCWGLYELPQVLEISTNGTEFEVVARQTAVYSEAAPWVVELPARAARYVRVRTDSKEPRELVLSELEVWRGH